MRSLKTKNDTFRPLDHFRDEMDSTFKNLMNFENGSLFDSSFSPKVDVIEKEDRYLVEAELPGIDEKEMDIQLKDHVLTIKGEKKSEHEEKSEHAYHLERSYGRFERSFTLAKDVQADQIKANYKKGILKVELPKDKTKEAKKIQINEN